jgi:hypothetical protein
MENINIGKLKEQISKIIINGEAETGDFIQIYGNKPIACQNSDLRADFNLKIGFETDFKTYKEDILEAAIDGPVADESDLINSFRDHLNEGVDSLIGRAVEEAQRL